MQLTPIPGTEPGVVFFKVDQFQFQVFLNPIHMQSLHIKVSPIPASGCDGKPIMQWSQEEIQIIEQFFELRVAAPPYRPNALSSFGRALNVPPHILKDVIQLMRLDLMSEPMPGFKWTMQFCMRVPPSAYPSIVPAGNASVILCGVKILFFVSISLHST